MITRSPRPEPSGRGVLTSISANKAGAPFPKPTHSFIHSIPKASLIPDVFGPGSSLEIQKPSHPTNGKRPREIVATSSVIKRPRLDEHVKDHSSKQQVEEAKWRARWVKVFPTLVFHFEFDMDEAQRRTAMHRVSKMGAKVDQFFSNRVTHVIVKSLPTPSKQKTKYNGVKGHAMAESPNNPFLDNTGVTDLAQKAATLQMKVWTLEKLSNVLSRLAPVQSSTNDTLHTLLEDEKVHGTRERDLSAPRSDYYYFKHGSKYLLVEDATGRHRTIMVKEYPASAKAPTEWPVLFESFLRPSSSSQSTVQTTDLRARAWALYVQRRSFLGEKPPNINSETRSTLRDITNTPQLPPAMPYQNASGNSVVITSNIASTTSTIQSPAMFGGPSLNPHKDRAIMQMSKRIQVLKGNAHIAAAKRADDKAKIMDDTQKQRMVEPTEPAKRSFMTQDQVLQLLRQVRAPADTTKVTTEERRTNRAEVEAGLRDKEQDVASGYCENCRLRYSELSSHITSKKHRRFATDPANFVSLDSLLLQLQRPLNPKIYPPEYPPCNRPHEKDADCFECRTGDFSRLSPDNESDEEDTYAEMNGGEGSDSASDECF